MINLFVLTVKWNLVHWVNEENEWLDRVQFPGWTHWSILATPLLWGIALVAHGLYVFSLKARPWQELKPSFLKNWEERQLERMLREEEDNLASID